MDNIMNVTGSLAVISALIHVGLEGPGFREAHDEKPFAMTTDARVFANAIG
jgi:hypothetical protein